MLYRLLLLTPLLFSLFLLPLASTAATHGITVGTYPQEMSKAYTTVDGLPSDDVRAMAITTDGTVYAGTAKGLSQWDGTAWQTVPDSPKPIHALLATDGDLYIAASTRVYRLTGGSLDLLTDALPASANSLHFDTVNTAHQPAQSLLVATNKGLFYLSDGAMHRINVFDEHRNPVDEIRDVTVNASGHTIVSTPFGAYILKERGLFYTGGDQGLAKARKGMEWQRLLPTHETESWGMVDARSVLLDEAGHLLLTAPQGVAQQDADGGWRLTAGHDGLPYNDFTTADVASNGRLWLGTGNGAIHYDGEHWAYRAGKRWLPNNAVRDIVATDDGAWIATAGGVSRIYFQDMTFAEKAEYFESEIDRFGRRTEFEYINGVTLETAGDTSKWTQHDTDNDGQYTGLYGAAECLAYGATGSAKAKERATKAFEALAFLSEVTQSGSNPAPPGFIARSILPTDGRNPNEHDSPERDRKKQEGDALWKVLIPRWPTSGDGKWYWKTDASSDELDGHFLMYALYYDHVAETDAEKAQVREVCARVMDHLIDNDFRLVDHDRTPTRWGNFSPESLNGDPNWWTERGLNSLSLLTYLTVTHHVTGEQKYRDVFMDLVENHYYALNGMVMPKLQAGPGSHVQFDDKMAFMNYYNLIRYEKDPEVLRMFQNSIFYYWQIVRQEKNPFFNFVYAALCDGQGMQTQWGVTDLSPTHNWLEDSVDTLKRFPMNLVLWPMNNSHRIDIVPLGTHTREPGKAEGTGHRVDGYVIPIDERNAISFSEDTWRLDDGGRNGKWLDEGSPFLLGYYLGLYHGFIVE